MYSDGCKLSRFRLCDSDFGITPVDYDIIIIIIIIITYTHLEALRHCYKCFIHTNL
jgi:hypothetical protein